MAITDVIARLAVSLSLDTTAFQTGSRQARTEATALQGSLAKVGKVVGVVSAAFVAAGGVAVVKNLIAEGLDYASSLGEVAQQLGVTTRELQEYRYVASQVGIDQQQMDRGLAKLSVTLGDVAAGAERPRDALERLGFSTGAIADLAHSTAGEALPRLADAFAKIPDPAARAELAAKLFGERIGPKFLSLLEGGAEGINGLRDAAHRLGVVLSDEQIQNADKTADKIADLKQVLSAKIAGVVADNADSIYRLADALANLAEKAITATDNWLTWNRAMNARGQMRAAVDRRLADDPRVTDRNRAATRALAYRMIDDKLGLEEETVFGPVKRVRLKPRPADASTPNPPPSRSPAVLADETEDAERRTRASAGRLSKTLKDTDDELQSLLDRLFPDQAAARQYQADRSVLDAIADPHARNGALMALAKERGRALDLEKVALPFGQEPLAETTEGLGDFTKQLARMAEQAGVTKVRVVKSFKDMADETLQSLNRLTSAVKGGGFLDILSAVIGVGLQLGGAGVFGKSIAARINAVPGHAAGTLSAGAGLALVGEQGPELVRFRGGERVFNHRDTMGMMGGGQLDIRPSPLFDVYLDGKLVQAAPALAEAGGRAGVAQIALRQSRRI